MALGKWQDFGHAAKRMEDGFTPRDNRVLTSRETVAGVSANDERFVKAIWASGLADEIKSGRMSLGMQLEESGCNLSGGQRQKVALARTFAQPCRILLLDEPTLGLDPDGERLLAERLPQLLSPNDVLIMTTHSAVMLAAAQRVIALDGGKVIADGDREKLVRVN
jgi:ABC-type bacteriocin/lantibiotic exporter with double-glycine peptidase domain